MQLWTHEEIEFLKENYSNLGRNECAVSLNRSRASIGAKAQKLGLKSIITKADKLSTEYADWLNNTEYTNLEDYVLSSTPILHKHTICGHTWKARPNNIKRGYGCPNCAPNKKLSHQQYVERLTNTEFELLEQFTTVSDKLLHKHSCGYEWLVRPHDIFKQNCPKCSKRNYSAVAIKWLDSFNNSNIQHAENGGEVLVSGYKVDGYDRVTNTVYEFHGDVFHGNLDIFAEDDFCHPFNKNITAGELWQQTFDKMNNLAKNHTVYFIWEKDYRNGKTCEQFNTFAN